MFINYITKLIFLFALFGPLTFGRHIDLTSNQILSGNSTVANGTDENKDSVIAYDEVELDSKTFLKDLSPAKFYTSVAGASYCSDKALDSWNCKHCIKLGSSVKFYKVLNEPNFQTRGIVVILKDRNEIALAFQGAENAQNWLTSLKIAKTPFPGAKDSAVNTGFKNMIDAFRPIFIKAIKELLDQPEYRLYNIVVTGHSLGGALSNLASIFIQQDLNLDWNRISVYTYGQPRVGNEEFARWYNELPFNYIRQTNKADPVPHAPPSNRGYFHVFTEVYENGKEPKVCSRNSLEDPTCSNSHNFYAIRDHSFAFSNQLGVDAC